MTDSDPKTINQAAVAVLEAEKHRQVGDLSLAEKFCQRALELDPNFGDALYLQGVIRKETGDSTSAVTFFKRATNVQPNAVPVWLELARTLNDIENWTACAAATTEVLKRDPNNIEAELMRAVSSFALHDLLAATASIERVAKALPDDGGVHLFHARCLMARKEFSTAHQPALRAVQLQPESAEALYILGACLKRIGQNEEAETILQRCLAQTATQHEAWNDLADIYFARGDTQRGLVCLRRSHAAVPFNLDAISGLCFYTAFDPNADAATLYDINRDYSCRLSAEVGKDVALAAPSVKRPDDRIRIAYLAYDMHDHVTSWFLEPILARHDREKFHVTGYYGNETVDHVTERLGGYVDSWQWVAEDRIADTVARIRRDNIDILILASFFRGKDRRVLAHRCAPLQVGYHNRVASSGLETVDYIITEEVSDPTGLVEEHYTEALVRVTNHNVYLPPSDAPSPRSAPYHENGFITFGSFNNIAKIGDNVVETWSQILKSVPQSRLILRSSIHFENAATREFYHQRFKRFNVDPERLIFQGLRPLRSDHLGGMGEADIILDPFPCNGGTTSCEALWMGVPLVTLETPSYMGRQGASYLVKLGLEDLIASNPAEYVKIATRLAGDLGRIDTLRGTMRLIVENKIFDYEQHILELETAYQFMLQQQKKGQAPAPFSINGGNITEIL